MSGSELLREVREGHRREGSAWRTPHGTKLLVYPSEVQVAMRAIDGLRVGASHVVVSEALAEVVLAEVNALPRRLSVKLKGVGRIETVLHRNGSCRNNSW